MLRPEIIDILKGYKRLLAIRSELQYNFDGMLNGSALSGMPHGTNISNPIQNALNKKEQEIKEIDREINRIDGWMQYMTEEEKYFLQQIYIEGRFIGTIIDKWGRDTGNYYARNTWKKIQRKALSKIEDITNNG